MFPDRFNRGLLTYKQAILIIIFTFLLAQHVTAGNALELNSVMMRNTYRIDGKVSEGKSVIGSCFLIGKPFKEDPKRAHYVLVTAAHILEKITSDHATIYLRIKEGDLFREPPLQIRIRREGKPQWVKNKSGLDVAAMYVRLPRNIDVQLLPTTLLADDKTLSEFEIHPGDEMFCLGFPFGLRSSEAGFPILRSGRVASFPLVPTQKYRYFLLDFEVFSGNSGGPVYFIDNNRYYSGGTQIGKRIQFIAGIVSQELSITEDIKHLYGKEQQRHRLSLAIIIHASYILETVNQLPKLPE